MTSNPADARLSTLRVPEAVEPSQSLLCGLGAVLSAYGRSVPRDELAAVLGDAFLFTFAADAGPSEQWNSYGRHAFLESAARLYGLELRDLHPPDAAPLPLTPPEFEGHFEDSYLPLVRTALEHGHPALAWMGWPPPQGAIWGVISGFDPASGRCVGQTISSSGRPVALHRAPVQVYTVQEYRETRVEPAQVLAAALDHAAVILNNRIPANYRVVSGPASLEAWRASPSTIIETGVHRKLAQSFVADRRAALRFFAKHRHGADTDQIRIIDEYGRIFERQTAALLLFTEGDSLAEALDLVIALERRAAVVGATLR